MNTRLLRPLLFLLLIPGANSLFAQDDGTPPPPITPDRMQEIKAQKSAFITRQLQLTTEEARTFWPIYDSYDAEMEAVRKQMRSDRAGLRKGGTLSDAQAAKMIDQDLASRQQLLDIRKKYTGEFEKSIGAIKTLKLGKAERDFNRELLKRMRPVNHDDRGRRGR